MTEQQHGDRGVTSEVAAQQAAGEEGLLGRIEVIEAQALDQRAAGYERLADELLSELERSDAESVSK